MSYQEKNAWVSAVALLVVFVPYFYQIGTRLPAGRLDFEEVLEMLVASTVLMILLCIFIHIVLALVLRRSDSAPVGAARPCGARVVVCSGGPGCGRVLVHARPQPGRVAQCHCLWVHLLHDTDHLLPRRPCLALVHRCAT